MFALHPFAYWISITLFLTTCARAEEVHHKRIPTGFTGVRGKKSVLDEAYSEDDVEVNKAYIQQPTEYSEPLKTQNSAEGNYVVQKRAPSGFFGMRGKKPWNYPHYEYPNKMDKGAPISIGEVLGKEEILEDNGLTFDEASKSSPVGVFGMKDKKFWIDHNYPAGTKKASMGFVGMRGKKDSENPIGYFENDKRAPSGFFGMRGKKQPSGFFGMRGKKYPYEFRGKFVGVRGKKSSEVTLPQNYYSDTNRLADQLDLNQLMLLLTDEQNDFENISQ